MITFITFIWHWFTAWLIGWGGIAAAFAGIAWLLWFFTPAFLSTYKAQLLHIAIGATIFSFAQTYFFSDGYKSGYAVAIHAIAAQDKGAVRSWQKAKTTVDNCFDQGGTWNVSRIACDKP